MSKGTGSELTPNLQLLPMPRKKRIASAVLYLLAALWRVRNRRIPARVGRVVVLEPFGFGDMITFEPLVRELHSRDLEVVICSKRHWRALFPEQGKQKYVDLHLPFATHNEAAKYRLGSYFSDPLKKEFAHFRQEAKGAVGLETRGDIRCVLALYAAGCSRVITLSNYMGSDLEMWRAAAETVPFDHYLRRWELNLEFLRPLLKLSARPASSSPRLSHLIHRKPGIRAGLMPVAPWAGKWWPRARWEAVATHLRKKGFEVVAFCGPNQSRLAQEQVGLDLPIIECGSVESWAEQFNRCALVVTVDSGPMHLADAMEVPLVALFGVGKLPLWAPSGAQSVVVSHQKDPDFSLCHLLEANVPHAQKFMQRITVEEVTAAVDRVLNSSRPKTETPAMEHPA